MGNGQVMEGDRLFQGDYSLRTDDGLYQSGNVLFFPTSKREAIMFFWPGEKIRENGIHIIYPRLQKTGNIADRCEQNRGLVLPEDYIPVSDSKIETISFFVVVFSMIVL